MTGWGLVYLAFLLVSMRPELDLLLCCSRTKISPEHTRRIHQLIQQNLDWQDVLGLAQWHGINPLLYWQLNALDSPQIPPQIFQKLRESFQYNVQRNLFLTSQLLKLVKLFRENCIAVIPFKGPILATTIYQNMTLRKFYDLDLLITPQDFYKVKQILISQGYHLRYQLDIQQESRRLITNYECEFIHEKLNISIDLHWQFAPPYFNFFLQPEKVLAQADTLELGGTKISILNPQNLLFVLCINGTKDGWFSLQRICDIAEFIQAYPTLDWSQVWQQADDYQCTRMVVLGLILAYYHYHVTLPTSAWDKYKQDPAIALIAQKVCDRIAGKTHSYLSRVQLAYFGWQLQPNWYRKINYSFKIVFAINERDLAFMALPKGLFFLYYPLRLLRLFLKYGLQQKVP